MRISLINIIGYVPLVIIATITSWTWIQFSLGVCCILPKHIGAIIGVGLCIVGYFAKRIVGQVAVLVVLVLGTFGLITFTIESRLASYGFGVKESRIMTPMINTTVLLILILFIATNWNQFRKLIVRKK